MKKVLAMFPGQGSQFVGMSQEILAQFPYTKEIFEMAEDAIKINIRELNLKGPEEELKLTANTQPCILTQSVATWKVLEREKGFKPDGFAGHSLGEYSALVAAGRLDFVSAVKLVRKRGEFMQEAVPAGAGAMTAVLSCEAPKLEAYCKEVSDGSYQVEVVNYNSPQQLVVAGATKAVKALEALLQKNEIKFVSLPVSAPFHSSMMKPAREKMSFLLNDTKISGQSTDFIPNLSAEVGSYYKVDYLISQIDSPVRWTQSINNAVTAGYTDFIEVGPGRVLQGLVKRIVPKGEFKLKGTDPLVPFIQSV